jgi:two-component system chemotaxis family response regulator WspR
LPSNPGGDAAPGTLGAPLIAADTADRVVLIDDQPVVGEAVRRLLVDLAGFDYCHIADPRTALARLLALSPSVVLLDLVMPDIDGLTLLAQIRQHPQLAHLPVVLLSTTDDAATKARAFEAGADDYLVKLPERAELQARLRYHSRNHRTLVERDAAFEALRDSQRKLQQMTRELLHLSRVDGLTGLLNRRYFDEQLALELRRARRSGLPVSLVMIDIDCFKAYNDHCGHVQGDICLKAVAAALRAAAQRAGDHVARYGGEEFAVIAAACDAEQAGQLAQRLLAAVDALALPHPAAVLPTVTLSLGHGAALPQDTPDSLIRRVDAALYQAKQGGRHRAQAAP